MTVLKYRDTVASALLGTNSKEDSRGSLDRYTASKHRPVPQRLYLIGWVIYNAVIAAAIGAASWAFLVLALSPELP